MLKWFSDRSKFKAVFRVLINLRHEIAGLERATQRQDKSDMICRIATMRQWMGMLQGLTIAYGGDIQEVISSSVEAEAGALKVLGFNEVVICPKEFDVSKPVTV